MTIKIILKSGAKFKIKAEDIKIIRNKDGISSYEIYKASCKKFPLYINPSSIDTVIIHQWFKK